MSERDIIDNSLKPLFEKAEKEGLWFNLGYQNLWFSPSELKERQAVGQFVFSAENWRLRDPKDRLDQLIKKANEAQKRASEFAKRAGL